MQHYRREPLWYKDAIIYEVNIKGFYDSNGDGIGDFAGLTQKLDYLEDLGVTAIWILPFYPSPLRDDGYDIADYYTISPAYGTLDDFKAFLDEAHRRNLKVITELVINHTSNEHPWFQRARRAAPGSPERDYYVWSDTPEKYKDVRIIFQDFEPSNWTWDPVAKAYFWHRFYSHQPDLNFDNPAVQEEIFNILDYWAGMGIDGFRLDAIPYLFEREGTNCENLPETHVFLKRLRRHVDEGYDNILFLAEANMWPEDSASYFGNGDECHMNYHFPLMPRMYMSVKMENRHPITDIFEQTPEIPEVCQWATFLRNHDELTLEMVTDEERDFMYQVYAKDRTARINLGIRRRLAPLMDNDRNRIELLNVLLLSLPGTPVIYYGDEIGMGDNFYLGDRDGVRTPMQWDSSENAGFSDANPQQLYLPVIRDPEYAYRSVNVRRERSNQNSLFWWTKRLLAKRKEYQVFGRGSIRFLRPENGKVLAFVREIESEMMLVVVNLSRFSEAVQLDLSEIAGYRVREVFGRHYFPDVSREPYFLTLSPYGYLWLQLEKTEMFHATPRELQNPAFDLASIDDLANANTLRVLENRMLPAFLLQVSWGGAKMRQLEQVQITHHHLLRHGEHAFVWLFLNLTYHEGLPETVQLPLAFEYYRPDEEVHSREEVIGVIRIGDRTVLVLDALYNDDFRRYLLTGFQDFHLNGQSLIFETRETFTGAGMQDVIGERSLPESFQLVYRDLVVKIYRRLDSEPVRDLEIKQVLNEHDFDSSPEVLGHLSYRPDRNTTSTLAIYEKRLETQASGWDYVLDQVRRMADELLARRGRNDLPQSDLPEISLLDEMHFQDMPEAVQNILGSNFVARLARLGRTTAAFHRIMAETPNSGFQVEPLSLHYQRSLYAGLKSQARETMDLLRRHAAEFSEEDRELAQRVRDAEGRLLDRLKRIFDHKIEADKVRIQGDYTLEQLAIVDDDFVILNFDGDPEQPFTQRRIRRSPGKDLAGLLRSLDYAFRFVLCEQPVSRPEDRQMLERWFDLTYRCLGAEVLTAYRRATAGTRLLTPDLDDLKIMLDTFMIEKALQEVRYEARNRPQLVGLPLRWLLTMV